MNNCPYPTDPVEIILSDGKTRRVRFTAGALRRSAKTLRALGGEVTSPDVLIVQLWEGLIDKEDIKDQEDLAELIDARAIKYLSDRLGQAIKDATPDPDPTKPAGSEAAS